MIKCQMNKKNVIWHEVFSYSCVLDTVLSVYLIVPKSILWKLSLLTLGNVADLIFSLLKTLEYKYNAASTPGI